MTNKQHPITPSSELLQDWGGRFYDQQLTFDELVTEVYKAGADQKLEACCEWVSKYTPYFGDFPMPEDKLRDARRPKPPSLTERALARLTTLEELAEAIGHSPDDTIRQALERLKELERPNDQAKQYMKDA